MANPGSTHDGLGKDGLAAGQRRFEPAVGLDEPGDEILPDADLLDVLKPLGVLEEQPDRDRVRICGHYLALIEVRLESADTAGVKMPVGPGAKEHAVGHLLSPEHHRLAHDDRVDTEFIGVGSGRQRVWPIDWPTMTEWMGAPPTTSRPSWASTAS